MCVGAVREAGYECCQNWAPVEELIRSFMIYFSDLLSFAPNCLVTGDLMVTGNNKERTC